MDKVVVIGGSGFMGSHLADVLSDRGFQVTIFDHRDSPWKKDNQQIILGDILDKEAMAIALEGAKYVYHFAGIADIAESKKNPMDTININLIGTMNAVQASLDAKVNRFIMASTMYVYSPYGSFYRASKQACEAMIEVFSQEYDFEYSFLRYGSLYGPRAQKWNGLRGYIEQIIRNGKLEYRGTGEELREYIHVLDAANLSVDILDEKYSNKAITITGHQSMKSDEMIDLIFEIAGREKSVDYKLTNTSSDHYVRTPYRFTPKIATKLIPDGFYDLGQGILEIIEEVSKEKN